MTERHSTHVLITSHDHTGYPEEDNIGTSYKIRSWIIVLYFLVIGIKNAIEERDRPKPAGEPCVKSSFVLNKILSFQIFITSNLLGFCQSLFACGSNDVLLILILDIFLPRKEISRNTMTPPQLTTDTPILDILEPVTISRFVLGRIELNVVIHHWRKSDIGKMLHANEPLQRKTWFDRHIGTF